jgi:hypothetical protein
MYQRKDAFILAAERFADIALDELTRWTDRRRFDDDVTFVVAQIGNLSSGPSC